MGLWHLCQIVWSTSNGLEQSEWHASALSPHAMHGSVFNSPAFWRQPTHAKQLEDQVELVHFLFHLFPLDPWNASKQHFLPLCSDQSGLRSLHFTWHVLLSLQAPHALIQWQPLKWLDATDVVSPQHFWELSHWHLFSCEHCLAGTFVWINAVPGAPPLMWHAHTHTHNHAIFSHFPSIKFG